MSEEQKRYVTDRCISSISYGTTKRGQSFYMVCSMVAMRHQGALPYGCEYLYKVWSDMRSDGALPCGCAYLMKEEII